MARRRRGKSEEKLDLEGPEHAYWADSPIDPLGRDEPAPAEAPAEEPTPEPAPEPELAEDTDSDVDPYGVLRLDPSANWEDIVGAYRRLARWWHPDGLIDPSDDEREACEHRLRELNEAYQQLRVRRGR